eukprot:2678685-Amphidinium_carterae.1
MAHLQTSVALRAAVKLVVATLKAFWDDFPVHTLLKKHNASTVPCHTIMEVHAQLGEGGNPNHVLVSSMHTARVSCA